VWSLGSIYTHPTRPCGGPDSAGTWHGHPSKSAHTEGDVNLM